MTVNVYAYVNPIRMESVPITCDWYSEGKILESGYKWVIALKDGYKCQYEVIVYKFRKVDNVDQLFAAIKRNAHRTYTGWIHHAQVYDKKTRVHIKHEKLDFHL